MNSRPPPPLPTPLSALCWSTERAQKQICLHGAHPLHNQLRVSLLFNLLIPFHYRICQVPDLSPFRTTDPPKFMGIKLNRAGGSGGGGLGAAGRGRELPGQISSNYCPEKVGDDKGEFRQSAWVGGWVRIGGVGGGCHGDEKIEWTPGS